MRKITLHSGTMLAQQREQPCACRPFERDSDEQTGHHERDENQPMGHSEHLDAVSVRGVPRYLKYMPISRPTQLTASASAINRNQPAANRRSNAGVTGAIVPEKNPSYYIAS